MDVKGVPKLVPNWFQNILEPDSWPASWKKKVLGFWVQINGYEGGSKTGSKLAQNSVNDKPKLDVVCLAEASQTMFS